MHVELGGYHVGDVEIACGLRRARGKVGPRRRGGDLRLPPNNTLEFARAPATGRARSSAGPTLDGLGNYLVGEIEESDAPPVDVAETLRRSGHGGAGLLPAGRLAARDRILCRAGAGGGLRLRQLHPGLHRLRSGLGASASSERGLPIVGDDIKSQVGATIVHRMLANLFRERGVRLDRTYQLNFGGNTDFKNMLERERLESKKISKTQRGHRASSTCRSTPTTSTSARATTCRG